MKNGSVFGLVGFILGACGAAVSITAIVFSALGLAFAKRNVRPHIR